MLGLTAVKVEIMLMIARGKSLLSPVMIKEKKEENVSSFLFWLHLQEVQSIVSNHPASPSLRALDTLKRR